MASSLSGKVLRQNICDFPAGESAMKENKRIFSHLKSNKTSINFLKINHYGNCLSKSKYRETVSGESEK
jgi:hypothetical protein